MPRSTMRVPQPDIIEHFGNADAVPQLPERCLSRKAGIVRCCLNCPPFTAASRITKNGMYCTLVREQYSQKLLLHQGDDEILAELERDDIRAEEHSAEF